MSPAERSLEGRRILLTRPAVRAGALLERLRACGALADARPTYAVLPAEDPQEAITAVSRIEDYAWVVFTSVNGVRFFLEALERAGRTASSLAASPRVAAIGPATAAALLQGGLQPALVARDSRSEGLAFELRSMVQPGQRVLLVRPQVARQTVAQELAALGAVVDCKAFYRNVPSSEAPEVGRALSAGAYDVAVFASPSALTQLLQAAGSDAAQLVEVLRAVRCVAIGPVTAAALETARIVDPTVAGEPSSAGLFEAIQRACAR